MSTPLDLVTPEEMNVIENHINENAETGPDVSIPYLLREWNSEKQGLFHDIFDEKSLIISKEVSFKKNVEQIQDEIGHQWDISLPEDAHRLYNDFINLCFKQRQSVYPPNFCAWKDHLTEEQMFIENAWYRCENILSCSSLAHNAVETEFTIDLPKPDGTVRKYHVQKGSRPMRVLRQILRAYNFSDEEAYKSFCTWYSRILNDRELTGELCLSIHPIDYITMSENNCDWSSCMNWPESGCYRGGTIEMMNSPMVLVAYLKSSSPMMMSEGWDYKEHCYTMHPWNSKKWRILIVVDKSGIYSVKGYPYYHKEMTQYVVEWVASLLKNREFDPICKVKPYHIKKIREHSFIVSPKTERMYNDFGSTEHWAMFDWNYLLNRIEEYPNSASSHNIYIPYSGKSECMCCGELAPNAYFDTEEHLCCVKCAGSNCTSECSCCGNYFDDDDLVWVEDSLVCSSCFREQCFEDDLTYAYYFKENGIELFFKTDEATYRVGMVGIDTIRDLSKDAIPNLSEKESITLTENQIRSSMHHLWNRALHN